LEHTFASDQFGLFDIRRGFHSIFKEKSINVAFWLFVVVIIVVIVA
jgi:hypothetical protein